MHKGMPSTYEKWTQRSNTEMKQVKERQKRKMRRRLYADTLQFLLIAQVFVSTDIEEIHY